MAIEKLNSVAVSKLGPGNHGDGGGLYLRVIGNSRTWAFRYRRGTKKIQKEGEAEKEIAAAHWIGLGRVETLPLKKARDLALKCRAWKEEGEDVRLKVREHRTRKSDGQTFDDAAKAYIEAHKAGWKNEKHAKQWRNTLDQHAGSLLTVSVKDVDVKHVLPVVQAIWAAKTETASRLRGRIEAVLDYAKAQGWRTGQNPARWKGHMDALLPARSKVAKVEHHAALGWRVPGRCWQKALRHRRAAISLAVPIRLL